MTVQGIKGVWIGLLAVAMWLVALLGALATFPVELSIDSGEHLLVSGALQFVTAAAIGIFLVYVKGRPREQGNAKLFLGMTCVAFAVFAIAAIAYIAFDALWTCNYASAHTLVIGSALLPDAQHYFGSMQRALSCQEMLAEYAGDAGKLWNRGELLLRFLLLSVMYFGVWIAACGVVVFLAAALWQRGKT